MGDKYIGEERREITGDIIEARAAVLATTKSLDSISDMLMRHFRLGIIAVGAATIIGLSMFYVVLQLKDTQGVLQTQADQTQLQAVINEVEVVRHRVHEREGHRRLCIIALGASRPVEVATRICDPVVGEDFKELQAKLKREEKNLIKLREELLK